MHVNGSWAKSQYSTYNGSCPELDASCTWVKSRYSNPSGNCPEMTWTSTSFANNNCPEMAYAGASNGGACPEVAYAKTGGSESGNSPEIGSPGDDDCPFVHFRESDRPEAVADVPRYRMALLVKAIKDGQFDALLGPLDWDDAKIAAEQARCDAITPPTRPDWAPAGQEAASVP